RGEVRGELGRAARRRTPIDRGRSSAGGRQGVSQSSEQTGGNDGAPEAAASLAVYGADAVDDAAPTSARQTLVAAGVPRRLANKDATLWGPQAQAEAAIRLGWVDTFRRSRALLPKLAELAAELSD